MIFEFYTEPFDTTKPPSPPPLRTVGDYSGETKQSKKKTEEWSLRLEEYGKNKNLFTIKNKVKITKETKSLKFSRKKKTIWNFLDFE